MTILLTGAAGYIGSHAALLLLQNPEVQVVGVDSLERGNPEAIRRLEAAGAGRFAFAQLDLRESSPLRRLLAERPVKAILHFAAWTQVAESVMRPAAYWEANAATTANLLGAAREAGVARIILSSTAATYGAPQRLPIAESDPQLPITPYGQSKLACEQMLVAEVAAARVAGRPMAGAILRYFNVAGASAQGLLGEAHAPETHLVPSALGAALGIRPPLEVFGDDYPTVDGTCVRDYVHIEDLVRAHVDALGAIQLGECRAYNVGIGHGFSVREILAACERVAGRAVPTRIAPRRAGDPPTLVADPAKIMRELGWSPRLRTAEEIVRSAWQWIEANPNGFASASAITSRS